jgi:hypothetical protein
MQATALHFDAEPASSRAHVRAGHGIQDAGCPANLNVYYQGESDSRNSRDRLWDQWLKEWVK